MTREEIFSVIKSNIEQVIEGARGMSISENDGMSELGADSLDVVEVVSRTMKQLQVKIPQEEMPDATNLKELLDLFEKAKASETP